MPVTWREFAAEVRDVAAGLMGAGVQPNDLLPDVPES